MLPLWIFLLAWLLLVALYVLMSFISVMQLVRYGIVGTGTYAAAFFFVACVGIVLFVTGLYLLTVDWTQSVDLVTTFFPSVPGFLSPTELP